MKLWSSNSTRVANVGLFMSLAVVVGLLSFAITRDDLFMTLIAGVGMAAVLFFFGVLNFAPDTTRAQSTEQTLEVASGMLKNLNVGLTPEAAEIISNLLLPETSASAIAITNTETVLGYSGNIPTGFGPGTEVVGPTQEVLESKRMETFARIDDQKVSTVKGPVFGIIVPLLVQDKTVGTIKLYYQRGLDIDRTQLAIARGFGELLSTQLSSHELDRQAELTARAEVKALQAQINPHFLFNTLNTIAALTRTHPAQARDLLREFSQFYRRTLENSEHQLIPLWQELEQTRRYLVIEKARFGEDRIAEMEHVETGCEALMVPSFLVQPIVENAVRHAMRDRGTLHIDVHVEADGDDVLIAVTDDGLGMDDSAAERLLNSATLPKSEGKDTGIALRNVHERIERFYGVGSGVEIVSKLDEGTCVTLRLVDAALDLNLRGPAEDEDVDTSQAGDKNVDADAFWEDELAQLKAMSPEEQAALSDLDEFE